MLLLLILSATVTGSLVLGRPILWYLDGKKKEAVSLFVATVGFLFLITIFAFFGAGTVREMMCATAHEQEVIKTRAPSTTGSAESA